MFCADSPEVAATLATLLNDLVHATQTRPTASDLKAANQGKFSVNGGLFDRWRTRLAEWERDGVVTAAPGKREFWFEGRFFEVTFGDPHRVGADAEQPLQERFVFPAFANRHQLHLQQDGDYEVIGATLAAIDDHTGDVLSTRTYPFDLASFFEVPTTVTDATDTTDRTFEIRTPGDSVKAADEHDDG